jgi:hypothetical protein
VIDNGALREVFGLQKEQATADWKGFGDSIVKSVMVCTVSVIIQMDGAYGTNGREDKFVQSFGGET